MILTCSTASPSLMMLADCPLVWALEEYNMMSRSATLWNLGWTFSFGSTKCSISAMVNSLRGNKGQLYLYQYRHIILKLIGAAVALSPDTNESRARRDFIPEGVSYLSSSEGQFSLVKFQQALEVKEDSLSRFRPQIAAKQTNEINSNISTIQQSKTSSTETVPWHIPAWSNGRLKHQVERDGRAEVISCGGRLDAVLHKEVSQFLLSVVVHL